jgi:hypothetical protein
MGRRGEKKVTVWKYEKDKASLDITVYLVDASGGRHYSSREDGATTFFRVEISDLDIREEHPDINILKHQVWAELDKKLAIKWTDWLYVEVSGDIDTIVRKLDADDDPVEDPLDLVSEKARCNVVIEYSRLQLGQIGDQKMQRDLNNYHQGKTYYNTAREGWPDVGASEPDRWYKKSREMRALVPDTAENRAALDAISAGFDKLLQRLRDIMSPDKVLATLAGVKVGQLALPGVTEEKDEHKASNPQKRRRA